MRVPSTKTPGHQKPDSERHAVDSPRAIVSGMIGGTGDMDDKPIKRSRSVNL
jgi:hypothetical protein